LKKNLAIIIVLILAIIAAVFIYFGVTGRELPFGLGGGGGGTSGDGSSSQGFIGKLSDALNLGTAMQCSWEEEGVDATFYVKNNKLRGSVTSNGQTMEYIFRDNCYWYWGESDGEVEGIKMCWDPSEVGDWNWEDQLQAASENYDCKPGTVSDSMFNPPSNVEFMDMSDYMQQYMPSE
jgi:hypothetical protein